MFDNVYMQYCNNIAIYTYVWYTTILPFLPNGILVVQQDGGSPLWATPEVLVEAALPLLACTLRLSARRFCSRMHEVFRRFRSWRHPAVRRIVYISHVAYLLSSKAKEVAAGGFKPDMVELGKVIYHLAWTCFVSKRGETTKIAGDDGFPRAQANFCKQLLVRKRKFPETCDSVLSGGFRPLRHPSQIFQWFSTIDDWTILFHWHSLTSIWWMECDH